MSVGYIGLLKVELPTHTAYLSDGGFAVYDGNTYQSTDSILGTIASIEPMTEGKTGEIPALDISFNIPAATAITLFQTGALQSSTVKLWLAKYNVETGLVIGTPDLQFLGQVDQPIVRVAKGEYSISLSVVSKAEWFFSGDTGNGLSATFHKDLYAGETGHDNGTGLSVATSWGTEGAVGGGTTSGSVNPYQNPNTRVQN